MSNDPTHSTTRSALATLRKFFRPRASHERCELCSAEIGDNHSHLFELANRSLRCACEPCAILFSSPAAAKYRRVPRTRQFLPDFHLPDLQWLALDLPINLAFFVSSSAAGRTLALYPSPAGATEAVVPQGAWEAVVADNPGLRELEPDVEALLVNRLGDAAEHYRVGIDVCYTLVGVVRTHWRGMSGGPAVWEQIKNFFASLKEATP
jgi:hypothetical protein